MKIQYIVAMVLVVLTGGFLLLNVNKDAQPAVTTPVVENDVFDGDATTVGTLDTGTTTPLVGSSGITKTVLATHNKQSDCWVAYKDVVYDITSWLPRHPGSAAAIAPYCGTSDEFTAAFSKKHGTSKEAKLVNEGINEDTLTQ